MKLPKMRFEVKFDDVREIVKDIAALQKYQLSEDDDRNLVDIAEVVKVLQLHITAAPVDPEDDG